MVRKTAAQRREEAEATAETQQQDILVEGEAEMLKTEAEGEWEGDYLHRPDGTWGHRKCTAECRQDLKTKRTASSHARFSHGVAGTTRPRGESGGRRSARQLATVPTSAGVADDIALLMAQVDTLTSEVRRLWKIEDDASKAAAELAEARRAQVQLRRALNETTGEINRRNGRPDYSVGPDVRNTLNLGLSRTEMRRLQESAPGR